MVDVVRSPLKRVGGKFASAHGIIKMFPDPTTYKQYVEPCVGAAHVLFAKPRYDHREVIGDLENNLVIFWQQAQLHAHEMQQRLDGMLYSRYIYYEYYRSLFNGTELEPMERAIRYFYVLRATGTGWMRKSPVGWNHTAANASAYFSVLSVFEAMQERLRGVRIDNRDVLKSIERYDGADTFIYIDPPYFGAEWYYEASKDSGFPHEAMAERLRKAKSKVAISYYPHPALDDLYPVDEWNRVTWEQTKSSDIKKGMPAKSTEMLLTNYEVA